MLRHCHRQLLTEEWTHLVVLYVIGLVFSIETVKKQ